VAASPCALWGVTSSSERAERDKPDLRPEVWRISIGQQTEHDKSLPAATVCHVLQVDGVGPRAIARVAGAQRGVICRGQLLAAGMGRGAIAHRASTGALYRILPRVYSIGHDSLQALAAEVAALLSIGRDCVISHGSAAAIWGLCRRPEVHVRVTVAGRSLQPRATLRVHRVARLDPRDLTIRDRLPVTSPARTLIDLASAVPLSTLERALAEARVQRLIRADEGDLMAAMDRVPGRPGVASLRRLLEAEARSGGTRSEAERRLRSLVANAQLPRPVANVRVAGHEVDFLWGAASLVVEVDGHQFHGHRSAFERDRRRDQALVAGGYRVIRVTWRQLVDEPLALVARIAQALGV
jgi:very-short-patch-repair endonuclease